MLAFVFLHEEFTAKSLVGCMLIGAGTSNIVSLLEQLNENMTVFAALFSKAVFSERYGKEQQNKCVI